MVADILKLALICIITLVILPNMLALQVQDNTTNDTTTLIPVAAGNVVVLIPITTNNTLDNATNDVSNNTTANISSHN